MAEEKKKTVFAREERPKQTASLENATNRLPRSVRDDQPTPSLGGGIEPVLSVVEVKQSVESTPSLRGGTTKQSVDATRTLVPKLRFKEFDGEWEKKKLEDVGKIRMCKRIFSHETSENGEIPFFKIGTFGKEADAFISNELYVNYRERFSFPKIGDILMSASGTLGRTVVYDGSPAYFQDSNIVWIDNKEELITNAFLFYIYQIVRYDSEGGTIQRLYNSIIYDAKFSAPSLPEQQKIASFLSAVDEKIQQLNKKKALLEQYKKGVMQQLFSGTLRFKDENGEDFPDWEVKRLGEIISIFNGYAFSGSDSQETGCRWIKIADVGINEMKSNTTSYLPNEFSEKHPKFILKKGDFVIALTRPILNGKLKIARINDECDGSLLNQRVGKLESSFYLPFTYYLLQLRELIDKMDSRIAGTDPPNLSPNEINGIKLNISTEPEEQKKIANYLSALDAKIETVNQQISKTQEFKKGLLQQLFAS